MAKYLIIGKCCRESSTDVEVFLLFAFPVEAEKLTSVPMAEPLQERTSGTSAVSPV